MYLRTTASLTLTMAALLLSACGSHPATVAASSEAPVPATTTKPTASRVVRATGTIQAVRSSTLRVPQLAQTATQRAQLTLVSLIPNGTAVKTGDLLAEFDPTTQLDELREAKAKLSDLEHQREEKRALVNSDAAKRLVIIREAEVELGKAELELQKGPVLAELDRRKNEVKAAGARERLANLNKAHESWLKAEAATVKVLELKASRQGLVVQRLQTNVDKLSLRAPHDGMVAHENVWRNSSMGPPQVGDQMWGNQPVMRIFDPTEMIVDTQVNEPDVSVLGSMATARIYLDAYPAAAFEARLLNSSPVATAGLESPVKSFSARFKIEGRDARLLPDLSASLEITIPGEAKP